MQFWTINPNIKDIFCKIELKILKTYISVI